VNVKIKGKDWFDGDPSKYKCDDYEKEMLCATDGDLYPNKGHTANTACCACGGGMDGFEELPTPAISCSDIKCADDCVDECGWSSSKGKCKEGGTTSKSERGLGVCPKSCEDFECADDCTNECGWSTSKGKCLLGGKTSKSELGLGKC